MSWYKNFGDKIKKWFRSQVLVLVNKDIKEKALISWRAPEFYLVDKSTIWGILMILFFSALAALLIYFDQILAALVAILFMIVVLKFAYAKPETLEYRVEESGFRVSGWLHPYYDDIISFWIGRQGRHQTLYLQTRNIFTDHLSIPIKDISTKKLSRALEKYLPERLPPQTPKVLRTKKK